MLIIRQNKNSDIKYLVDIWLTVSLEAHNFINEQYWIENKILMEEQYLPNAEIYLAEDLGEICGFVALVENNIAAIFVSNEQQGKGIGSLLLQYIKELRTELTLSVYQKNDKSVGFYQSKGFKIVDETIDIATTEKEFTMKWNKI